MKKLVLHAVCALSLFAGISAQAMYDRVKSYMPRVPKMSMPSVDYKTALQRFNTTKARFESALKSNKKALIVTAAAALIAAIALIMRSRRQAESGAQGVNPNGGVTVSQEEQPQYATYAEAVVDLMNQPNADIVLFTEALDEAIVDNGAFLNVDMVQRIHDSSLARSENNKRAIGTFLLDLLDEEFADNAAYLKMKALFTPAGRYAGFAAG